MNKILIATFDSERAASEGLTALKDLHSDGDITLYASSVIAEDAQGNVAVREAADSGPVGTLVGVVTGGLIGVIAGPAGVAVGAYVGGFGGLMFDLFHAGFGMDFVDEVSTVLTPGKAAVVADIDESWVTPVDVRLGALGGITIRRVPRDVVEDELYGETQDAKAELARLEAELAQTSAEAKANVQAAIARQRQKLQALAARANDELAKQKAEFEAKLNTLRAQLNRAHDEQRQRVQGRIDDLKADHEARQAKLVEARRLAKESAEITREALGR